MPIYEIELTDGRKFQVEADSEPTEADVLAALPPEPARKQSPAGADRFVPQGQQIPRYERKLDPPPVPQSSAADRFLGSFIDTVNPMNAIRAIPAMIPFTEANQEATYARMKAQEANPITAAISNSPLGQFGGAQAGQRIGEGDVAEGLGQGMGEILLGASSGLGARTVPKIPGVVGKGGKAALSASNKVVSGAVDLVERNPAIAATLGAIGGAYTGGIPGAIAGLSGGAVPRIMKSLRGLTQLETARTAGKIVDKVTKAGLPIDELKIHLPIQRRHIPRTGPAATSTGRFPSVTLSPKATEEVMGALTSKPRISADAFKRLQAYREALDPVARELFDRQMTELLNLPRK